MHALEEDISDAAVSERHEVGIHTYKDAYIYTYIYTYIHTFIYMFSSVAGLEAYAREVASDAAAEDRHKERKGVSIHTYIHSLYFLYINTYIHTLRRRFPLAVDTEDTSAPPCRRCSKAL